MNRDRRIALALALAFAAAACESGDGGTSLDDERCTARFAWLQKDAYRDGAGRTTTLWPPHTTTTLTVTCGPPGGPARVLARPFQANHGTEPGQTDAAGNIILVEMRAETQTGLTHLEAQTLLAAYESCQCEDSTDFLTLDALQGDAVQSLVTEVGQYLIDHLDCGGNPPVTDLVAWLQAGDIPAVIAALPACTFDPGADLEAGLSESFLAVIADLQQSLEDYHVCNNDALLQAGLWFSFVTEGQVVPCDATSVFCQGPLWYYEP